MPIYRRLRSKLGSGRDLYVLADTSYGRRAILNTNLLYLELNMLFVAAALMK